MVVDSTTCGRCGWSVGIGEVVCPRCGVDAAQQVRREAAMLATSDVARPRASAPDDGVLHPALATAMEAAVKSRLNQALVGQYDVEEALGRSGMCAVYLAADILHQRRVAIKVVLPNLVPDYAAARRRVRREAQLASELKHPNIIPIYAVSEEDDLVFFVMKHIAGPSLDEILKGSGRLPVAVVRSILYQVASGLDFAHKSGVIHRDVKPANIMIDTDGTAVLTDFGIATAADGGDGSTTALAIGTPFYLSPEQCSGKPATAASDQYSLGIVAYEALTGEPPFVANTIAAAIKQHLFTPPPSLDAIAPNSPNDLRETVMRMLEKSPELRWSSLQDVASRTAGADSPHVDPGRARLVQLADGGSSQQKAKSDSRRWRSPHNKARLTKRQTSVGGLRAWRVAIAVVALVVLTVLSTGAAALVLGRDTTDQTSRVDGATNGRSPFPTASLAAQAGEQGTIILGTRASDAVFFVSGKPWGVVNELGSWQVPAGKIRLSVYADGCEPWDSTVVVSPGAEVIIGYRGPECGR
jgi:serine/threonine protein kinase